MKCYQHLNEEVVAQCQNCSRGLCTQCSNIYQDPICHHCANKENHFYKKSLIKKLSLSAAIFIISFLLIITDKNFSIAVSLIVAYQFASIPWGWSALNRITPNIFLIMPIMGWVIYFMVKLYISVIVGFFVAPFKIYGAVRNIRLLQS